MEAAAEHPPRRGLRWRLRAGVVAAFSVLVSTLVATAAPTAAHATLTNIPCPGPEIGWVKTGTAFGFDLFEAYTDFRLISSASAFSVADVRVVENTSDVEISGQFTSLQSQTFTLQVSIGLQQKVAEFLTSTLGVTVIVARTTSLGVTASSPVPPHSTAIGEYGLFSFDVVYDAQRITGLGRGDRPNSCATDPARRIQGTGRAPTLAEGWRISIV